MEIGEILHELRKKQRLSMSEAALASGYNKATISMLERGRRNGGLYTIDDILNAYGYELKVIKKGLFEQDIVEWTQELPETMHPDKEADETMVKEFGIPLKSDNEYIVLGDDERLYSSRLYLFEDGTIEADGYNDIKPIAWMQAVRKDY